MNKNYIKILKCLTFIMFVFSLGCRTAEDIEVKCANIAEAPDSLKNYFLFNKGTWWVYNLLGTNDTDKRTVTYFGKTTYNVIPSASYGNLPCIYYYTCMTDHTHPYFKNSWQGFGDAFYINPLSDSTKWSITHRSQSNTGSMQAFLIWPIIHKNFDGIYEIDSFDAQLNINGLNLNCLKINKIKVNASDTNAITSIYFSQGIGIVKYQIGGDKTWLLRRYKIN